MIPPFLILILILTTMTSSIATAFVTPRTTSLLHPITSAIRPIIPFLISNRPISNSKPFRSKTEHNEADDFRFEPKFDGQLFYGIEADDKGMINTSVSELHAKVQKFYPNDKQPEEKKEVVSSSSDDDRERVTIRGVPVINRTLRISFDNKQLLVTIWEMEEPSNLVQDWMMNLSHTDKEKIGDPFGVVMWPGSIVAVQELLRLCKHELENKVVLVLGAGTGVEAQAAAMLGAKQVIATDINKMTLALLEYGAERAGLGDVIEGRVFDLFSEDPLPPSDIILASDILYNENLARQVGKRCREIFQMKPRPRLIVTDSQRFHGTDFLKEIDLKKEDDKVIWEERVLKNVMGSGVLIKGDQVYDVKTRILNVEGDDDAM